MPTYILGRLASALLTIAVIATLVFVVLRLTADPIGVLLPAEATQEDVVQLRRELGLDRPLHAQYIAYLAGLTTGNLGKSFRYRASVIDLIVERLPATLKLVFLSMVLAMIIAVPLGTLAAVRRDSVYDYVATFLSFVGFATPAFWLGLVLMIVFAVQLGVLPSSGSGTWRHLILPTVTLATWPLGQFTRLVRSQMLEVLGQDYIRTAWSKGLGGLDVYIKHAFRNASLPLVTLSGLIFGSLLGGAVVTETVFAWPGMGRLVVESVFNRDFPLIQASVVYLAVVFILVNVAVDLLYTVIDPRIRLP